MRTSAGAYAQHCLSPNQVPPARRATTASSTCLLCPPHSHRDPMGMCSTLELLWFQLTQTSRVPHSICHLLCPQFLHLPISSVKATQCYSLNTQECFYPRAFELPLCPQVSVRHSLNPSVLGKQTGFPAPLLAVTPCAGMWPQSPDTGRPPGYLLGLCPRWSPNRSGDC